ncbi:hypothetical protein FF098_011445 [Parvularcula flava]|uniref:Uncharacterized protein n=1 Tax=Aquisalinus luteolus TaxID=1566827 RepID=A0A8J3A924_9PROT|nr:hypothetical protein [Aquisalinus luteolus]NHK28522.1 hypothetical protein [Aquisalinus luteolus]GGH98730.1 hypothetical protein GCM10011355_23010 [Aquisalinus luteolus]
MALFDPDDPIDWQKTRQLGKVRFMILLALAWGWVTAIITTVLLCAWQAMSEGFSFPDLFFRLAVTMLVFPLVGLWFSHSIWRRAERNFLSSTPEN